MKVTLEDFIARKSGNDWYIGAMTDWDARTLDLTQNFLDEGGYEATIFMDGPDVAQNPKELTIVKNKIRNIDSLSADMSAGGGYAVHLRALSK